MPGESTQPVHPSDVTEAEFAIAEAIERGRADVLADRATPHDEVAREVRGIIEAAREGR
jgi:hypothetical protein